MNQVDVKTELQQTFLGLAITFVILTGTVTAARFYCRKLKHTPLGADDWLALAAMFFYWAEVGVHLWSMLSGGVGENIKDVSPSEIMIAFKSLTTVEFPYTLALACIRSSICILLIRIFANIRWLRLCAWGIIGLNICWAIFIIVDALTICYPLAYNWNQTIPGGHCANKDTHFIVMAVWGIIQDLMIWLLPQLMIWRLQMSLPKKIALCCIFCLGLFDVAVEIVRIVQLENLDFDGDFTYTLAPVEIWSFIETGVAIIIADTPLCLPLLQLLFPGLTLRSTRPTLRKIDSHGTDVGGASPRELPQGDSYEAYQLGVGGYSTVSCKSSQGVYGKDLTDEEMHHGFPVIQVRHDVVVSEEREDDSSF